MVQTWDDTEVARRWVVLLLLLLLLLLLCPILKDADGQAEESNEMELNTIRHDWQRLETIRLRRSDSAWRMRLLCQNVATRAILKTMKLVASGRIDFDLSGRTRDPGLCSLCRIESDPRCDGRNTGAE